MFQQVIEDMITITKPTPTCILQTSFYTDGLADNLTSRKMGSWTIIQNNSLINQSQGVKRFIITFHEI